MFLEPVGLILHVDVLLQGLNYQDLYDMTLWAEWRSLYILFCNILSASGIDVMMSMYFVIKKNNRKTIFSSFLF